MMEEIVDFLLEGMIQANIKAIARLYSAVPDEFNFAFLASMKVLLDGLLPTLSESDRELYDKILERSELTVIMIPKPPEGRDPDA